MLNAFYRGVVPWKSSKTTVVPSSTQYLTIIQLIFFIVRTIQSLSRRESEGNLVIGSTLWLIKIEVKWCVVNDKMGDLIRIELSVFVVINNVGYLGNHGISVMTLISPRYSITMTEILALRAKKNTKSPLFDLNCSLARNTLQSLILSHTKSMENGLFHKKWAISVFCYALILTLNPLSMKHNVLRSSNPIWKGRHSI